MYDFPGKTLRTKTDHSNLSAPVLATERKLKYDHAGRLIETNHKTGSGEFVRISRKEYNELGQLTMNGLHGWSEQSFMQSVDYRYNIRGWLTRINESDVKQNMDIGSTDFFGMNIGYENGFGFEGATPQFNGNISAVKYSADLGPPIWDPAQLVDQALPNEELRMIYSNDFILNVGIDPTGAPLQQVVSFPVDSQGNPIATNAGDVAVLSQNGCNVNGNNADKQLVPSNNSYRQADSNKGVPPLTNRSNY